MILLEMIIIVIIISSSGIYVTYFNNSDFTRINNVSLTNLSQWSHGNQLTVTESNGIMEITSHHDVYATWLLLNSRGINVYTGETILLSVYARYNNAAQSALRIIGNTSNGQSVLGYAFIIDGNSSWHYYSLKITVPSGISSVFVQLPIGWVISNVGPETIMLKNMLIYKVEGT